VGTDFDNFEGKMLNGIARLPKTLLMIMGALGIVFSFYRFGLAKAIPNEGTPVTFTTGPLERDVRIDESSHKLTRPNSTNREIYKIDFQTEVSARGDNTHQSFVVGSTTLTLYKIQANEGNLKYGAQLSEFNVKLDGVEFSDEIESRMVEDAQRPFVIVFDHKGNVSGVAFPNSRRTESDGIIKGIVATLQFVRSDSAGRDFDEWIANEVDNLGSCLAKYKKRGPSKFEKSVGAYLKLYIEPAFAHLEKSKMPKASLRCEYELAPNAIVKFANSTQSVRLPLSDVGETEIRSTYRISLVTIDSKEQSWPNTSAWTLEPLGERVAVGRNGPVRSKEELRRQIAGSDLNSLTAEMKDAIRKSDENGRLDAGSKMTALFDLEPERTVEAAYRLRQVSDLKEAQTILGALAAANNPQSRVAIENVAMDTNCGAEIRHHAIVQLGLHESPSDDSIEALEKCVRQETTAEMKSQSLLSLGGVAGKVAQADPSSVGAQRAISSLVQGYNETSDRGMKDTYLAALGNSGALNALDTIRSVLSESEPQLRANAVLALRLISGEDVDRILVNVMLSDPDSFVRQSTVSAIAYRTPTSTLLLGCATSLQQDSDEMVRLNVVSYFSIITVRNTPEAMTALQMAIKSDPSSEVRRVAAASILAMKDEANSKEKLFTQL
jgi:hypothetical protein